MKREWRVAKELLRWFGQETTARTSLYKTDFSPVLNGSAVEKSVGRGALSPCLRLDWPPVTPTIPSPLATRNWSLPPDSRRGTGHPLSGTRETWLARFDSSVSGTRETWLAPFDSLDPQTRLSQANCFPTSGQAINSMPSRLLAGMGTAVLDQKMSTRPWRPTKTVRKSKSGCGVSRPACTR